MGRPRRALLDKHLHVAFDRALDQQSPYAIVPVVRRFPEAQASDTPVFYIVYDPQYIEARVAPAETDEQSLFVARARREAGVRVVSIPNGGYRDEEIAVKMKNEGMTAGMPDLFVYGAVPADRGAEWRAAWSARAVGDKRWDVAFDRGLEVPIFIEMKKRNGGLDDIRVPQLDVMEDLSRQGYPVAVCYGCKAAFAWLRFCGLAAPE